MLKRIFLFAAVNLLVIITLSITLSLLGVRGWATSHGIDYGALLVTCAVWGFGGALFSLAISRWSAKAMMGVQVIDPAGTASGLERELVQRVHRLAQKAGLPAMPEVGVYSSPEVNAFATGPSKARALVAVSTGLLESMDDDAVDAVLAHEITHVANGDMVTMLLIQGVINTFVMFFARIFAWGLAQAMSGDRDREDRGPNPLVMMIATIVFEIGLSFLGMIVVSYFSRRREFRADAGGARYAGREQMIHALQSLKRVYGVTDDSHPSVASLKINGKPRGMMAWLATHPDLDTRIEALRRGA
jgi:heat shock protein HtpX